MSYMQNNQEQCFLLITTGRIGRQLIKEVDSFSQLQIIVIFCMDKQTHEEWSKDYEKVQSVDVTI